MDRANHANGLSFAALPETLAWLFRWPWLPVRRCTVQNTRTRSLIVFPCSVLILMRFEFVTTC